MSDLFGLAGMVLVAAGVWRIWGWGWSAIAVGAPLLVVYIYVELSRVRGVRGGG